MGYDMQNADGLKGGIVFVASTPLCLELKTPKNRPTLNKIGWFKKHE
jgi:hypothetical protein